jgi:hypothetical protein
LSAVAPAGSLENCMSSPRSITCKCVTNMLHRRIGRVRRQAAGNGWLHVNVRGKDWLLRMVINCCGVIRLR